MKSQIFVSQINHNRVLPAMEKLIAWLRFPEKAKKIGIKLNLCDYRKVETGVTSDPNVVRAMLKVLRDKYPKADIFFFENNATPTLVDNIYPYLGFDKLAEQYDINCVNLAHEIWEVKKIEGLHFSEIEVPRIQRECDIIINHPKLKTHGRTKITCGLKNMFGCYRIKNKVIYHSFLDDAIVDINIAIKSNFIIVDGNLCVEGNRGPSQGLPKKVGLLIGGTDIVAVDAFCAKLMGFNPRTIGHIRKAQKKKLGNIRFTVRGDFKPQDYKKYQFQFSRSKYALMQVIRRIRSWSDVG